MYYPIVLQTDNGVDYGVIVPDLPGCFSAGTGEQEAIENAKLAIESHIEILLEDGEAIAPPSSVFAIRKNEEYHGDFIALVEIDPLLCLGKTKKVNVTLPVNLLRQIDRATAGARDRSAWLTEAAFQRLQAHVE